MNITVNVQPWDGVVRPVGWTPTIDTNAPVYSIAVEMARDGSRVLLTVVDGVVTHAWSPER